jgi:hypothetical protein
LDRHTGQIAMMRADFAAEHAPQIWAEVDREALAG